VNVKTNHVDKLSRNDPFIMKFGAKQYDWIVWKKLHEKVVWKLKLHYEILWSLPIFSFYCSITAEHL